MNYTFKAEQVKAMILHWLGTPPNGYIGVSYGRNLHELLFHPLSEDNADTLLSWIKEDIPVLRNLTSDQLSIVSKTIDNDKKQFYIKIGKVLVQIQDNQGGL